MCIHAICSSLGPSPRFSIHPSQRDLDYKTLREELQGTPAPYGPASPPAVCSLAPSPSSASRTAESWTCRLFPITQFLPCFNRPPQGGGCDAAPQQPQVFPVASQLAPKAKFPSVSVTSGLGSRTLGYGHGAGAAPHRDRSYTQEDAVRRCYCTLRSVW